MESGKHGDRRGHWRGHTYNENVSSSSSGGGGASFNRVTESQNADGGIFGAYADGGVVDRQGLKPISNYTDSRGIMGSAHVGLVGEDGAEAIIPLSAKRRGRGIALWKKAGEILGIRQEAEKAYADGGIVGTAMQAEGADPIPAWRQEKNFGEPDDEPDSIMPIVPNQPGPATADGTMVTVPVTIDNVTLEVNFDREGATDTESIVAVLKANIKNLTDEIAHSIAVSLEQTWANMTTV